MAKKRLLPRADPPELAKESAGRRLSTPSGLPRGDHLEPIPIIQDPNKGYAIASSCAGVIPIEGRSSSSPGPRTEDPIY